MKPVRTRIGWADFGDYDHFGKRLHRDLTGRTSYVALAAFALSGVLLTDDEARVLDDIACAAHVSDPRVWPPKIARLLGTQGRPVAGMLAGLTVLDGDALGPRPLLDAIALVREVEALPANVEGEREGAILGLLRSGRELSGLGVQQRAVDERVTALRASLIARGRHTLRFWSAAEQLWSVARSDRGVEPNIFGASMTALADLGLSPEASAALVALLFAPQFLAHAFDGFTSRGERGGDAMLDLPPSVVRYVGAPPRVSPRARARSSGA